LAREFGLNLLATSPTVEYIITLKNGVSPHKAGIQISDQKRDGSENSYRIQSASEFPDPSLIEQCLEPLMQVAIFAPKEYTGVIMQLCQEKRGEYIDLEYTGEQTKFTYMLPLAEMIIDFFDKLKGATSGYASMTYEFFDYSPVKLVKMDILLNHEKVDAFSQLVVEERAASLGSQMTDKLKDLIPRHQFNIPVQAAIGGKIIARSDVKPFRKDVTQKLYGGDRSRKDKLLEAQKKGKKRMKMVGRVEIPDSAFLQVFKMG
jgi:GTP-binding protein LepA